MVLPIRWRERRLTNIILLFSAKLVITAPKILNNLLFVFSSFPVHSHNQRSLTGANLESLDGGITPLPLATAPPALHPKDASMRFGISFVFIYLFLIVVCFNFCLFVCVAIYFIFLLHSLFEAQYEEGWNQRILCGTDEVACQYSRSASHLPAAGNFWRGAMRCGCICRLPIRGIDIYGLSLMLFPLP